MKNAIFGAALLFAFPAQAAPDITATLQFLGWNDGIDLELTVTNPGDQPVCLARPVSIQEVVFLAKSRTKFTAKSGHVAWRAERDLVVQPRSKRSFDVAVDLGAFAGGASDLNNTSRVRYSNALTDCRTHRNILDLNFDQNFSTSPMLTP